MRTTRIRGSARGARVGGSLAGSLLFLLPLPVLVESVQSQGAEALTGFVPWAGFAGFLMLRPWFMGVWASADAVIVRGWYRSYRVLGAEIQLVEVVPYWGMVNATAIPWIPLVGRVSMLRFRTSSGKERDLPSTGGRYRTVSAVAWNLRRRLGQLPDDPGPRRRG